MATISNSLQIEKVIEEEVNVEELNRLLEIFQWNIDVLAVTMAFIS